MTRQSGRGLGHRAVCLLRSPWAAEGRDAAGALCLGAWPGLGTPATPVAGSHLAEGPWLPTVGRHMAAGAIPLFVATDSLRGAPHMGRGQADRGGSDEKATQCRQWHGIASRPLSNDAHRQHAPALPLAMAASTLLVHRSPQTALPMAAAICLPGRHQSTTPASSPPQRPPTWADKHCPPSLLPYVKLMRADAPIGTYLLALPCVWSIGLAASPGSLPDMYTMGLFSAGAFLLRSAGCTINDLWDRELDAKVERTKSRPLASGAITPPAAVGALAVQLLLGLGILLQLNDYSKVLGASSLAFVGTYPLMKRVTYWPQAFLGLTINWGAMLGYAAVRGHCDWPVVLPLYAAGVAWTLVYDTIYAHQDKADDVDAGVKSTALLFAGNTKLWLSGFAAISTASLVACGAAAGAGPLYYGGVAGVAAHYIWQIKTVDLDNGADCAAKFVSNKWLGAMLGAGIVADRLAALPTSVV